MTPEKHKEICVTLITLFDSATLMIMATGLKNGNRDLIGSVKLYNLIESIIIILFLVLAPESPYYLITSGKQKKGIEVLNYIARFNGSNNRISDTA